MPIQKSSFLILLLMCLASSVFADDRPNIVLILSDDQAWTDYGFMGHPDIQTPNIDQLARQSLVFKRGYVAAPLCRPSLASLVTGLSPVQHGVVGNDVVGGKKRAEKDIALRQAFHKHPSIVKLLTKSGYLTHQSGKWWEGSFKDGGFTHGMTHGDPKRGGRHGDAGLKIGRKGFEPIAEFIDIAQKEDKPFFLWYAPFLPHTPHNPPQRLLDKYSKEGRAQDVAKYYAMCEWFDETCGDLMKLLKEKGESENTMVFYICDNGWAARSTNAKDPNQKLWKRFAQRSKCSPYENGIRTPVMVSWPGRIEPKHVNGLAHATDFFPTVAKAANIEVPEQLMGIDLTNPEARTSREQVFGVTHSTHNISVGNTHETLQYLWCVENEWKLIERHSGLDTTVYTGLHSWDKAPVRLYNINDDPREKNDVADEHPEVVARMKKAIQHWYEKIR